jgi:hypothetical protein
MLLGGLVSSLLFASLVSLASAHPGAQSAVDSNAATSGGGGRPVVVQLAAPEAPPNLAAERLAGAVGPQVGDGIQACAVAAVPDKGDTNTPYEAWITVNLSIDAAGVIQRSLPYESSPYMPTLEECVAKVFTGRSGPALQRGRHATVHWTMNIRRS